MKKTFTLISTLALSLCVLVGNSFAALTVDQQAVTDAIDTMIADMATWGWTAVLAMATFVIGAKLFKRFMGSAT